jgi:hypothetical protein
VLNNRRMIQQESLRVQQDLLQLLKRGTISPSATTTPSIDALVLAPAKNKRARRMVLKVSLATLGAIMPSEKKMLCLPRYHVSLDTILDFEALLTILVLESIQQIFLQKFKECVHLDQSNPNQNSDGDLCEFQCHVQFS